MSTYRIRPLEWEHWTDQLSDGVQCKWVADTVGGEAEICCIPRIGQSYCVRSGRKFTVIKTLDEAKAWCAKEHERAILRHMEVVR